ncbi:MAG: transmembrane 220 family protein [Bacteroidota bacterium]
MKITNVILSILFFLFAIVQYNDPDPWFWIVLYGMVGMISAMAVFGQYRQILILLGIACCVLGMLFLLPDFIDWLQNGAPSITESMKAEAPHIELTREFLGFVVALLALLWHYRNFRKASS